MMYCIGIDISAETFTASCSDAAFRKPFLGRTWPQDETGWTCLHELLAAHHIARPEACVCMEATGVYSERISHFFYALGFPVYVEPPRTIKKAFYEGDKTDPVDSRQISEYPFRFPDRLHVWQPPQAIIDQLKTLLTARELVTRNKTSCQNTRRSLRKKQHQAPETDSIYETLITEHDTALESIDLEMRRLIDTNPIMAQHITHILSIKHIGFLLAVNLAVITDGFTKHVRYQSLTRYIGICPLKYQSGSSVYRRPSADGAGPARLRKLLYLAAMRLKRSNTEYQKYYARKIAEGKTAKVILNNIANRTIRLICGVINSGKPYMPEYRSIKP
jgi:transposase